MPIDIFSALTDPTQRSILEMLAGNDEFPASEIHKKRAQQRIYRLNTDVMVELDEWSMIMRHQWS